MLGRSDSDDKGNLSAGLVGLIIMGSLLLAVLLGYTAHKLIKRWTNRARSAKVLDEIEMEFVDDVDIDGAPEGFVELLRGNAARRADQ